MDTCSNIIEQSLRYSTKATFENYAFWDTLPPQLQKKIVKSVLKNQSRKLNFFFDDLDQGVKAPDGFMTRILVSLEATLYEVGDTIVDYGDTMKDLHFIVAGSCDLLGTHKVDNSQFQRKVR